MWRRRVDRSTRLPGDGLLWKAAAMSTAKQRERALRILDRLVERFPDAHCELDHRSPWELLVAVVLSAQATDVSVNKVTPALFARVPDVESFARTSPAVVEPFIQSIGLFRNKAKAVHAAMTTLMQDFKGQVPQTMDELLTLRGVARKTANVVLGNAFNINAGFVVDTHIDRLSKRLALAPKDATIAAVEQWLMAQFPQDQWCHVSHMLIWHGRRACKARMACCCEHEICREFGDACELGKK